MLYICIKQSNNKDVVNYKESIMYKFKHYNKEGKFLSETTDKQQDYNNVIFSHYMFVNDIIEIYKVNAHVLGIKTEQLIEIRRV